MCYVFPSKSSIYLNASGRVQKQGTALARWSVPVCKVPAKPPRGSGRLRAGGNDKAVVKEEQAFARAGPESILLSNYAKSLPGYPQENDEVPERYSCRISLGCRRPHRRRDDRQTCHCPTPDKQVTGNTAHRHPPAKYRVLGDERSCRSDRHDCRACEGHFVEGKIADS